jgi:sulfur relay (sulfurtransferase) DsrF/TusC family protein
MHKKYLIINTYSPTDGFNAEESLEFILSIASLEQPISILFLQNAAFQLLEQSQYELINRDLLAQTIQAFELFALKNIYIEDSMLIKLKNLNLLINTNINITKFSLNNFTDLYNKHDIILWY